MADAGGQQAARRVRTLTINLRNWSDEYAAGAVTMTLTGADEALPAGGEPGRQILPVTESADIDASGQVQFELIPTGQLKGGQRYRVSWQGSATIEFAMPDMDITLYDLLATAPVSPDLPSVLGSNPPDGTMAAIRANAWIRYNPVWVADSPPAVFFAGRTLWLDTSGGGQQLKYRGATGWVDIAGGGGGGGLTQAQVDARVAALVRPYARSTFANLDSLGTSDIEDADGLLWFDQSDSAEGKKLTYGAFRARLADDEVSDWAQAGNTDDIPAGKLNLASGGGLTQAQVDARVAAGVYDWAEAGNTEILPESKIPAALHVDDILDSSFTGVDEAFTNEVGIVDLDEDFTIASTNSTVERISQNKTNDDITVSFDNGAGIQPLLTRYVVDINGTKLHFPPFQTSISSGKLLATWRAPAGVVVAGMNTIQIFQPAAQSNLVPSGGTTGQFLGGNTGAAPTWQASPLQDDAVTPAMAQADSAAQKQAWRTRLGVVNGAGFIPFNRHTLTVGDGPIAGAADRGFQASGGAITAYGSLTTPTYEGADGITYTIRALSAVAPHAVRVQVTPRPPRTGADSILRAGLIIGGNAHSFESAFALDDLFGSTNATTFTFSGIAGLIPAVGSTVEVSIGGAADRYLDTLESTDLADVASTAPTQGQVREWNATSMMWEPATPSAGGGGLTQAQVDARADLRVAALVEDWAEAANPTTRIPNSKLPLGSATQLIRRSPAADITISNTASDGSYGSWTDVIVLPALASAEAGDGLLLFQGEVASDAVGVSGGDRLATEFRLVRTRGAVDTVLGDTHLYGPRNATASGWGVTAVRDHFNTTAAVMHELVSTRTGDVLKVQCRLGSQAAAARSVTASVAANELTYWKPASGGGAGGVGGQTGITREVIVYLWQRATSAPSAPSGGVWEEGWTTTPTGWFDTPAGPSGSNNLYRATGKATESAGVWTLSDWTVTLQENFTTRYSDDLLGTSPYFDARSTTRAFNTRLPTGAWSTAWIPIGVTPRWTHLIDVSFTGRTSATADLIGTFPVVLNLDRLNDLRFEVIVQAASSTSVNGAVDFPATSFNTEPYNRTGSPSHTGSVLNLSLSEVYGATITAGPGSSPINVSNGDTDNFNCRMYFRRANSGSTTYNVGSLLVYQTQAVNQRGFVRVSYR